jgi:hypothetical protein
MAEILKQQMERPSLRPQSGRQNEQTRTTTSREPVAARV